LNDLFELDFVKSEFELHGLRIDTLAFDNESKAFVIIEYKKDRNFSVMTTSLEMDCSLKTKQQPFRIFQKIITIIDLN
jgi:hypothetical protein